MNRTRGEGGPVGVTSRHTFTDDAAFHSLLHDPRLYSYSTEKCTECLLCHLCVTLTSKSYKRKRAWRTKTSKIKILNHGSKGKVKIYLNIVNVKQVCNKYLVSIFHINKVFYNSTKAINRFVFRYNLIIAI